MAAADMVPSNVKELHYDGKCDSYVHKVLQILRHTTVFGICNGEGQPKTGPYI
jgi:hypothetical protein